jgi:FkbM family methyltransferase
MSGLLGKPLAGLARAFGYILLPKRVAKYWQEISLLQRLLERLEIDCVIDVGANRGQYRDQLRELVGYRGRIVSVEPLSGLAAHLSTRAALEDPLWEVHACALGATPGTATLNVMATDVFSSFLQPDASAPFAAANTVVRKEVVEVRTFAALLQDLQQRHGVRRPFLKLDTQGFDLEVLRGGESVLSQLLGLQTEVAIKPLYAGMPTVRDTLEALEHYQFDIAGFSPIAPGTQFPRAVEMNCFAVHKSVK